MVGNDNFRLWALDFVTKGDLAVFMMFQPSENRPKGQKSCRCHLAEVRY